ncbi:MAG: hypothetical protein ACOC1X_01840 [Promethearchaeota archaeon]
MEKDIERGCSKEMGDVYCGKEETEWDSRHGILTKHIYYCKDCQEKINKQKKKNA